MYFFISQLKLLLKLLDLLISILEGIFSLRYMIIDIFSSLLHLNEELFGLDFL